MKRSIRVLSATCLALIGAALCGGAASGCSATPPEATASSGQALLNGVSTSYPVVEIQVSDGSTCTGISLTDTWVMTSQYCGGSAQPNPSFTVSGNGQTVQVSRWVPSSVDPGDTPMLLNLAKPLTMPSYPAVSNVSMTGMTQITCTGWSTLSNIAEQADFSLGMPSGGLFHATPLGGAAAESGDLGGACFVNDTIWGLLTWCSPNTGCTLRQISDFGDFIYTDVGAAPFCGTWTCGFQQAGDQAVSCGTCTNPATPYCSAGTCIAQGTGSSSSGGITGCPKGYINCGDGTCVPRGHLCQ